MIVPHAIMADTPLNLTATLGVSPTGFWNVQNRTSSWIYLMDVTTGDTPTAEDVAVGYAVQSNEHRLVPSAYGTTPGNPPASLTDFDLWALARIGGSLVAGDV